MGFTKKNHPEECSCCWIMGYGVDESQPSVWAEEIYSVDEECECHGITAGSNHSGSSGS